LAQANRTWLLGAVVMAGCTVLSALYLVRHINNMESGVVLFAMSLGATVFLIIAALRSPTAKAKEPSRNSPWD
jgi:hypothetical protein